MFISNAAALRGPTPRVLSLLAWTPLVRSSPARPRLLAAPAPLPRVNTLVMLLCYPSVPCERKTRVHTAAGLVPRALMTFGMSLTSIASMPEPRNSVGTLLELEYRIRLEMLTRRQATRSCACCIQLGTLPLASAHLSVMTPAALSSFSSQCP